MNASERALDFVREGHCVGLGTGHAASAFIRALATRVRAGFEVRAVATSQATAAQAVTLGIPLVRLDDVAAIDLTVDGADEVDPNLDLIKGYGGALVRERIVAESSRRLIILVGREKLVPILGSRGSLPVEVVPFGLPLCLRRLATLGLAATPRVSDGQPVLSDNGNVLIDCAIGPLRDPRSLDADIRSIPGVVGTGLFLGLADIVLVQSDDVVQERRRPAARVPDSAPASHQ